MVNKNKTGEYPSYMHSPPKYWQTKQSVSVFLRISRGSDH